MKFDIEGRMRNLRLPDGRTALLYSIFEAVMNGIQAIEERYPGETATKGRISIEVAKARKSINRITITDNGVGLNDRHFESFNVCDTMAKADIGGRGVGRLVWLKAFRKVDVESAYHVGDQAHRLSFRFRPEDEDSRADLKRKKPVMATRHPTGTSISLSQLTDSKAQITPVLLARSFCHHFFPIFIAGNMPQLSITIGSRDIDIIEYLSSRMQVAECEVVEVNKAIGNVTITHVYVDPKIAKQLSNSILLTAQGRVVESIEVEKKFALRELDNGKAYACVVRSEFLDDAVDQERTSFKIREEDLEAIKDAALAAAERFLHSHIARIRTTQKRLVIDLLEEHPQLAISVDNVTEYVNDLSPSMSDEDIAKTLFTLLYRHEKKVRAQIAQMQNGSADPNDQNGYVDGAVAALMKKVSEDAKLRLAEYTIKRHQIIQIARSMLKYVDTEEGSYELERTVHDFICPMGKMLSSKNYADHNLWLIDDLLSYYQFFASDKAMSAIGVDGERKEPDLLFFNPFGFRREDTTDPVVVIEFKRPGDENMTSNPIDQVLGYIEKLQSKTVKDAEGAVVSEITPKTPFECIVVCDLTEGAKALLRRGVAQNPTPDGLGFFGFSQAHNAAIRVISYKKLFRDAQLRNQAFFKHLGLLPEEVNEAITRSLHKTSERDDAGAAVMAAGA